MSSVGALARRKLNATANNPNLGINVVVTIPQTTPYSPSATPAATPETYTIRALLAKYSDSVHENEHVDGTSILSGDKRLTIPYDETRTWIPSMTSIFSIFDETWRVINCDTVRVGSYIVCHKLQIRK